MRCCMNTRRILLAGWGSRTGRRGIHIISVAMDAPQDAINTLAGKLGKIEGISAKTAYSNLTFPALQK